MNDHARFNFSGAHRWLNCEGSITLSEGLPEKPSTPYAKKGTLQHTTNAAAVKYFLDAKQDGVSMTIEENGVQVPAWQHDMPKDDEECEFDKQNAIEIAKVYTKYIWENVLQLAVTGKAYGIEEKVVLQKDLDLWGTTDFWAVYINDKAQRTGVIVDFKNGHFVVEVDKNPQLMLYAAAFRAEMKAHGKDLDVVRTVIIQPNANCEAYRECSYTAKQLDAFEKKIYKKVNAILKAKKPKFKVGAWCTFCPAMAVCNAYKESLDEKSLLPILKDAKLPEVEKIPDETLSKIALHADELEEFLKAVKAHIITRHISGTPVSGCKVVSKTGKRAWIKDTIKIAQTLKDRGVEAFRPKLITISDAKKHLTEPELIELTELGKSSYIIISLDDERPSAESALDML